MMRTLLAAISLLVLAAGCGGEPATEAGALCSGERRQLADGDARAFGSLVLGHAEGWPAGDYRAALTIDDLRLPCSFSIDDAGRVRAASDGRASCFDYGWSVAPAAAENAIAFHWEELLIDMAVPFPVPPREIALAIEGPASTSIEQTFELAFPRCDEGCWACDAAVVEP